MTPEEALLALRAVATLRAALLGLALYAFARLTAYVWRPLWDRVFVSTSVVRSSRTTRARWDRTRCASTARIAHSPR